MRATVLFFSLALVVCCTAMAQAQGLPDAPSTVINATTAEVIPPVFQPAPAAIQPAPSAPLLGKAVERTKVMDRKFLLLNGLVLASTTADMELTQHCQNSGSCVEMNPTIPRAHWAKHAVNAPTNLAVMYWSYRWKKQGKRLWWVPPLVDIGVHVVGLGSNIRFVGK
jgi:hypothetical protein